MIVFFASVGILTTALVMTISIYYVVKERPTPNATVKEAITSLDWPMATLLFIALPTLAGFTEGVPLLGFLFGAGFTAFLLLLQWWFGPI